MIRFGPAGWTYRGLGGGGVPQAQAEGVRSTGGHGVAVRHHRDQHLLLCADYAAQRAPVAGAHGVQPALPLHGEAVAALHARARGALDGGRRAVDAGGAGQSCSEAGRLGAVLVQFPWSFRNEPASRDLVDALVTAFEGFPLVLEVRHASWNEPSYYAELVERGLGFVNIDQPLFKNSIAPSARATSPVGYVRVHGRNYREWFRRKGSPMIGMTTCTRRASWRPGPRGRRRWPPTRARRTCTSSPTTTRGARV